MKQFKYPTNEKVNAYTLGLIELEMSRLMPDAVREACHKVTAGLDLLIGYYGRYDIYLKSVRIDPERLLIAHNGNRWHEFPIPIQNKLIKSVITQKEGVYKRLNEMKNFLEHQRDLMAKLSDEKYEKVVALQEEYENA